MSRQMRIAILGGTGPEGLGIAGRLAQAGEQIWIGSRSAERAAEAATSLKANLPGAKIEGAANRDASERSEVIVLAFPASGLDAIVGTCKDALVGKIIIDTLVPLEKRDWGFGVAEIAEGSTAERVQALLPSAKVVAAFKNQSAIDLNALERDVEGDVVICGGDKKAKDLVGGLIRRVPKLRPLDAGGLGNARALERITALLVNLNRRYKSHASIRITGIH